MKHTHFLLAVLLTALLFAAGCRSRNVTQGISQGLTIARNATELLCLMFPREPVFSKRENKYDQ